MSLGKTLGWLFVLGPWWPALALALLGRDAAPDWYTQTHPLVSLGIFLFVYSTLLYLVSVPLRNCSIYDFNWSLLPASVFVLHYAFHPSSTGDPTRRWLVIGAIWFWSVRLTGNWLIKGALAHEDFRYVNYRKQMSPIGFQVFAYVALFLVQSAMVLAMTLPAYVALSRAPRPFGALDVVATFIIVAAVFIEWTADVQSLRFRRQRANNPQSPRFLTTGLWRYSRHPNYFGELMVWWGVYLFSIATTGEWINWTLVGPITVSGLFLGGSIQITEASELARKPEYAEYQRTTSRLIPWPPKSR